MKIAYGTNQISVFWYTFLFQLIMVLYIRVLNNVNLK